MFPLGKTPQGACYIGTHHDGSDFFGAAGHVADVEHRAKKALVSKGFEAITVSLCDRISRRMHDESQSPDQMTSPGPCRGSPYRLQ